MTDFFLRLWSPVANATGAIVGVVALHLWVRFRRRMTTLRWTSQTQAFAQSGADDQHGVVEVLYNGEPAENVFVLTVQVANDTSKDVTDLELQAGLRDGSTFLSGTGSVRGSLRGLLLSPDYVEVATEYLAVPENERPAGWHAQIAWNRFFAVPVLNRGAVVDLFFLVHAPTGVTPNVVLSTDHEGVRLRSEAPKPKILGVRQDHAGWTGFLVGLAIVARLGTTGVIPLGPSVGVFLLGSLGILTGIAVIWMVRLVLKAMS